MVLMVKKDVNKLKIKLLGACCSGNCSLLERNVRAALNELNINVDIERVDDLASIVNYGCLNIPGLVINERLISQGTVLEIEQIKNIISSFTISERDS